MLRSLVSELLYRCIRLSDLVYDSHKILTLLKIQERAT